MKLLWVLLVIQCASLSHTQGIAAGVCDDWFLVSSILVFTVTIQPSGSVVTTLGGDARFQCIPITSQDNVQWLMNSSAALLNESIELGNAVVTCVPFSSTVAWLLDLVNLTSNYNDTVIQCSTPGTGITSPPVLLLLQGYVTCLHKGSLHE